MHYGACLDWAKGLALSALVIAAACGLMLWSRWVGTAPR
jgi:hypothetical protein